ncbi:carboxyl transferase domain-containing protein [Nocardioides sp. WS12]|uniref:carboxyl transferase domain-containing protein n=1 Tax=Nocardioides sp. WS12 TaxID=2486272 RepID=UPI0015FD75ED|nr:carboxyl transferase domain-containing protein [Nocardioides sp. WS12]
MSRPDAKELLNLVVDAGSWQCWDQSPLDPPAGPEYHQELARARELTGCDEAIATGAATIAGRPVVLILGEFSFLGGSIGMVAADRVVSALRRATAERLPVVALPTSGGTRMQEGTGAFLQMLRITSAVNAHRAAQLPYLVYLRHPTTGGVLASWGSLGHVTAAEPGALIGFLGPRVYQALHGETFEPGVQVAENLHRRGLVDAVLAPDELRAYVVRVLSILAPGEAMPRRLVAADLEGWGMTPEDDSAWASVSASRSPSRPGVREVLEHAASEAVLLSGTGAAGTFSGLVMALARFGDVSCVLIGQDRAGAPEAEPLGPAELREARRGMRLAAALGLPVVTLIDTGGAALSPEAESGGLAREIAQCLSDLIDLDVPTVSVLLGQGTGGAAIAFLPADAVIAARHGWLSPLPLEGASVILFHDASRAPEMADRQNIRAADLARFGLVDRIVPEMPDAADEPERFAVRVGAAIEAEVRRVSAQDSVGRHRRRVQRFDRLGANLVMQT